MRFFPAAGAALLLCACTTEIPDSAAWVGFEPPAAPRQAVQTVSPVVPAPQVVSMPPQQHRPLPAPQPVATAAAPPMPVTSQPLAAAPQPARVAPPQVAQPPVRAAGGGISEQDFPTLLARQDSGGSGAAQRPSGPIEVQPVAAQPVPDRPSDMPNVVHYALATGHGVGERRWRRPPVNLRNHQRNCASFVTADLAQEEFLRRGGPERDPLNLDPNGDGYACWWSPEPFRAAARAAR